jgi:hypothetical protein
VYVVCRAGLRHVVEAVIDMEQDRWLQPSAKYVVKQTERTSGGEGHTRIHSHYVKLALVRLVCYYFCACGFKHCKCTAL